MITNHAGQAIDAFCRFLHIISAISLLVLVVLVFHEVILRYVFESPTKYTFEFSQYLLVLLALLPSAWCLNLERHVKVDLIYNLLPRKVQNVLRFLGGVLLALFAFVVFWYGIDVTWQAYVNDERSNSIIAFPMWIPRSFVPLGALALMLQAVRLAADVTSEFGRTNPSSSSAGEP